jgi:glutamate synthase (NADPH/NADH) small chain
MVVLSLGFLHTKSDKLLHDLGVGFDSKGNIRIDSEYQTDSDAVFATGDAASGASLVVKAMYHGGRAAESIHRHLCSQKM